MDWEFTLTFMLSQDKYQFVPYQGLLMSITLLFMQPKHQNSPDVLPLVHRSPWEETIAKYFSGKTDSLTRLTYYYKITCTIKTTLIGWY